MHKTLRAAKRLSVSLSNWMGEISCEVLSFPFLLENPKKMQEATLECRRLVLLTFCLHVIFVCVGSTYNNLTLSFYYRTKKSPLFERKSAPAICS